MKTNTCYLCIDFHILIDNISTTCTVISSIHAAVVMAMENLNLIILVLLSCAWTVFCADFLVNVTDEGMVLVSQ